MTKNVTTAKTLSTTNADPLVGKWFAVIDEDGAMHWAGTVVAKIDSDHYLLHLIQWLSGVLDIMRIIPIAELATTLNSRTGVIVFADEEHLDSWIKNHPRHPSGDKG